MAIARRGLRRQLRPDGGDRPFARVVHVRERPTLRPLVGRGVDDDPAGLEFDRRAGSELVRTEHREEVRFVGQEGQLDGGHCSAPAGLLPVVARVRDRACARHGLHAGEPDPFHVPHHGDAHAAHSGPLRRAGFGRSRILRLDPGLRRGTP